METKILSDNANIITNDLDIDFYDSNVTDNTTRSKENEQEIAVLKSRIDTLENYNTALNSKVDGLSQSISSIQSGAVGNITTLVNQNTQDIQNTKNDISNLKQTISNLNNTLTTVSQNTLTHCFDITIKSNDKVTRDCSKEVGSQTLFNKQISILMLDDDINSALYNTYIDASTECSVGISIDGKSVTIYNFQDIGLTVKLIIQ
jgi:predicted RNase H-like nuclease (RuvC/YqgF family)